MMDGMATAPKLDLARIRAEETTEREGHVSFSA